MAFIKPDLSEVQAPITPGEYKVRVVGSEVGEWTGKDGKPNTPYINWTLETIGGEKPADNGRKIWHRTPVAGKGAFKFANFYKATTGQTYERGQGFDTEMLMGRELAVIVDITAEGYTEIKGEKAIN